MAAYHHSIEWRWICRFRTYRYEYKYKLIRLVSNNNTKSWTVSYILKDIRYELDNTFDMVPFRIHNAFVGQFVLTAMIAFLAS